MRQRLAPVTHSFLFVRPCAPWPAFTTSGQSLSYRFFNPAKLPSSLYRIRERCPPLLHFETELGRIKPEPEIADAVYFSADDSLMPFFNRDESFK